jgi:transcriptional regulator with XRE-family HTH domain
MIINTLIQQQNITKYKLAKKANVPQTTVIDICSGKAKLENCSAGTVYKLAQALNVTVETLLEHRPLFDVYKSSVCHHVKEMGDIAFILKVLESNEIRRLYQKHRHLESLYLLAMVDYLSRINNIPVVMDYNDLRGARLREPVYPISVHVRCIASGNDEAKDESRLNTIPEFLRHNIIEAEVHNVF